MKKIVSLFQRNYDGDRLVRDEVVPGAEWVLAGEGIATRKYDGVCTMVRDGKMYRRFTVQLPGHKDERGREKKPQTRPDFEPATEVDSKTGKQEGWIPVGDGPEDKYMREAFEDFSLKMQGHPQEHDMLTCEFLGPKSQGNVENVSHHMILPHSWIEEVEDVPRSFDGLREYFIRHNTIEGIVWHRENGDMVKIKGKDFGIRREKLPC